MIVYSFFFFFAPEVAYEICCSILFSHLGNPGRLIIIIIFYSSIAHSPFCGCTILSFSSLTETEVRYDSIYVLRVYNSVFSIFRDVQPGHTTIAFQPVT